MPESLLPVIAALSSPASGTALLTISVAALGLGVMALAATTLALTIGFILILERRLDRRE